MGACWWLRERAVVLVIFIILIVAAVVVYVVRAVKPRRVKFRAGLGKITLVDFEADGGSSDEPASVVSADEPKKLPGRHHRS
jgi:hypothetical protein